MKQNLTDRLWKSSNAIEHYFLQRDEDGLPEFKPKVAIVTIIVILVIFMAVSTWAR